MTELAHDTLSMLPPPAVAPAVGPLERAAAALRRLVERSSTAEAAGILVVTPAAREAYLREVDGLLRGPGRWRALARLVGVLGLSPFERDLLLLAAAVQLDPTLLESAPGRGDSHLTFGVGFALFGESAWATLSPASPLQRYRLVIAEPTDLFLRATLRIDESVLAFLLGAATSDGRVVDLVEWVPPVASLSPTHARVADKMAALWGRRRDAEVAVGDTGRRGRRRLRAARDRGAGVRQVDGEAGGDPQRRRPERRQRSRRRGAPVGTRARHVGRGPAD